MSHNLKKTVKKRTLIVSSASQYHFISSPSVYVLSLSKLNQLFFIICAKWSEMSNDKEGNNFSHKMSHFTYRFFIFFSSTHSMTDVAENGSTWKLTNRNLSECWGRRKEASKKCRWKLQKIVITPRKLLFYRAFFLTHSIDRILTSTISS